MSRQVGTKRQRYGIKLLDEAADLVRSKSITMSRAAKEYGIPKTTLYDRVHMKYAGSKTGPKTVLTTEEESRIAEWAVHMSRIGYGRTRKELLNVVKKIIDEDGRKTPFKDIRPGKDWLKGFLTRHPQLSIRTTLQLGKELAIISPSKIRKWFEDLTLYIDQEVKDHDLLRDHSRIYNADENGFSLCTTGTQVIGYKGAPVVYLYGNSNKSQLTIMAACSAAGHFVSPMIIFPGKRLSYDPLEGFKEAAMGRSDSGWVDAGVFSEWLTNVFQQLKPGM